MIIIDFGEVRLMDVSPPYPLDAATGLVDEGKLAEALALATTSVERAALPDADHGYSMLCALDAGGAG
jgi:hypothetical protein